MFCQKCGKENPDNAAFCNFCGAALKEPVQQSGSPISTEPPAAPKKKHGILYWAVVCIGALFVVFIVAALIAGFMFTASESNQNAPITTPAQFTQIPTAAPTYSSTIASTPTPLPVTTFQGTGDDVQSFTATGYGIRIFSMSYNGDDNFIVWLEDSNGNKLDLLANEIGSYSGKHSVSLDSGTYYLDVTAGGPWEIDLTSP
jgi:hypothetical protein